MEVTTQEVLNSNIGTGDAIVDWIFLEFRDRINNNIVLSTKSALIQRDGDIVGADGSPLIIPAEWNVRYIAVKHRNHIGVMTGQPQVANNESIAFDFT